MDKLKMHTLDQVQEHIKKIGELFPNTLTETIVDGKVVQAIDFDVLRQELSDVVVEGPTERYQFTWPDKRKSILLANAPIAKTLRPCREESVDFDTTENLYIEGDNLDALKLLQETYLGKVKMIYIDPPYNTGNDFVYEDDFSQSEEDFKPISGDYSEEGARLTKNLETNGRFHTDWLNMIYPRLKLAKDLLTDDGVLFISIDDNEVHNLKKICDEIFGAQNFVTYFLWTKTSTPPALSYKCRKTVEFVLAYEKKLNTSKYFGDFLDNGDAPLLNTGNPEKTIIFPEKSIRFSFVTDGIITPGLKDKVKVENTIYVKDGVNSNSVSLTGEFKWEQNTINNEIAQGTYFLIKTEKFSIRFQRINNDDAYKTPTNYLNIELKKENGVGTNESAVKELNSINLDNCFDYPKPISLIENLIKMVNKYSSDSIVLDFFSGSCKKRPMPHSDSGACRTVIPGHAAQ